MSKQDDFIKAIAPKAQEIQSKYGVPASIAIAQAALETGWGGSVKGNNLYGIKAGSSWSGERVNMGTHEVINDKRVGITDTFRAYSGANQSIEDYGKFLAGNNRYANVIGADAHSAADALQRAGYATDPQYAQKLKQIIDSNDLTRFDDASFKGYVQDDARFAKTRKRLEEQRIEHPQEWNDFISFFTALVTALFEMFGSKETKLATANGTETTAEFSQQPPLPNVRAPASGPAKAKA